MVEAADESSAGYGLASGRLLALLDSPNFLRGVATRPMSWGGNQADVMRSRVTRVPEPNGNREHRAVASRQANQL